MRIHVDRAKCAQHGQCEISAPEIFRLDHDTDALVVLVPEPDNSLRDLVEDAADACPAGAIHIVQIT